MHGAMPPLFHKDDVNTNYVGERQAHINTIL